MLSPRAELSDDTASEAAGRSYRLDASLQAWLADIRQLVTLGVLETPKHRRYPASVHDHESARAAARWVRSELKLDMRPIDSPVSACEAMGQLVAVVEMPGDLGVHASRDDREMVINSFAAELLLPMALVKDRAVNDVCSRGELIAGVATINDHAGESRGDDARRAVCLGLSGP